MLVANYSPLILTGWNYPSENVYEEFMKITMKRLEPEKELPATGDVINNFKKGVSLYDWLISVNNQNSKENPLFYQNASNPNYPLTPKFVNRRGNPYGISYSRTYYTIQGKRINSINSQIGADQEQDLNLLRIPQPPVGWYKRLRTNSGFQRNDFGKIASNVLTIGVYFNNTIYHTMPTSIIPFEINDTSNQYVKAFRLLYSRALRENKIADPQTIFEDRLKWSYYSLDEDAIMELDRTSDEAKKVVEDYYKQLDDMVLEKLGGYGFKHHSVRKAENFSAEGNKKPYSVEISRSSNPEKKLMAVFEDSEGNKIKTTHFGQRGASDYTKHGDKERMQRYLERHGGGTTTSTKEDWKDPTTAGSLSRWVLWNKPSLSGSFADYKRRFGLKGSLNVSKSAEGLETKNAESYSPGDYNFKQNFGGMNERFEVILESAQKLSKPKLKRVLGLEKENPLTRKPMIKAASIAYFMKEAKDQFPKEMYIEYYMKNFTKQELCHLNLIKGKAGWNLTELRKLNKRELSDMLIIEEMGFDFKSETFEATEWVGFCPECNKWRTKDMSIKIDSKINTTGWSIPDKLLGKRLCKKSQRFGKIRQSGDTFTGYGSRSFDNYYCGTPLTKVKSKYKAEFEAKSPAQKSLDKWTKEDWGTKSGKPSTQGEEATGERYLPAKAREALTDKEYARTTAKKRRDTKAGKQFSPQPDDIEEKVKEYRLETFEAKAEPECANCGKIMPSTPFNNLFTAKFCSPKCFREARTRRLKFEKTFEAIEGKGSNARFTDQPDPKVYRDTSLRQKARNKLLKGNKGGDEGEWSARKAQMAATEYRKMYENKYGEGKNPYF